MFDFNGVNVANHWYVAGEVFVISDCLVEYDFNTLRSSVTADKSTWWPNAPLKRSLWVHRSPISGDSSSQNPSEPTGQSCLLPCEIKPFKNVISRLCY